MTPSDHRVGLGVVGLGRAFTLMLPTFVRDERFRLIAATTPGREARTAFERDFDGVSYESIEALCADPNVDAVYIASPHQFHAGHVATVAAAGRHLLVDKPLAVTLEEGDRMVECATAAGVHLVVGPSHSFDAPVLKAREMINSEEFGAVRMINAMNYTDFLYRPRRPEELDTKQGGGVVFSQAIHQIDVVRLLAGGRVAGVRALTGSWDPERPTEGAYSALLDFEDGAFASLTYSGYGRFDSDEFMDWMGELGRRKDPDDYGRARRKLRESLSPGDEAMLKRARNFGHVDTKTFTEAPTPVAHEHFGAVIVCCEHADLRLKADGVMVYGDDARRFVPVPAPGIPRLEVMDELYNAVVHDKAPLHSAAWGLASLEAAVAILDSAPTGRTIAMRRQVGIRP